jgi:hypothetical protein
LITWAPVTNLSVTNTIDSPTLAAFAGYASGTFNFAFETDDALRAWVEQPVNTLNRSFTATLTASPEPRTWALWTVGVLLIGYALTRQPITPRS